MIWVTCNIKCFYKGAEKGGKLENKINELCIQSTQRSNKLLKHSKII
jgi:hypothetical protein